MAYDLKATLSINAARFNSGIKSAAQQLKGMSGNVSKAEKEVSAMGNTIKRVGGAVAGYFAVDAIAGFAKGAVEAAANVQAVSAQFEQVFGDSQDAATKLLDGMGKEFGMIPTRLKAPLSQTTSMFKGLGMSTDKAMKKAAGAVTIAADAAAFYDKSYEDANSALTSFIKGNYEGGESIGLFANETQMASWAAKNLGVDWKGLDEAGKQVARLEFAKAMQEAAGATGQAARESSGYENVMGNLKQSWTDLKAQLAQPFLEPVVAAISGLAGWLSKIDVATLSQNFMAFGEYMVATFGPTITTAKDLVVDIYNALSNAGGIDIAKAALEGVKAVFDWIGQNSGLVVAAIAGITGAMAAFSILNTINRGLALYRTLMVAYRTGTLLATAATWGLNTALLANPFTWVAVAIGAVIAVGVLLWKNWDKVKAKAYELWSAARDVFSKFGSWIGEKVSGVVNWFGKLLDKWESFKSSISNFSMPGWISSIGDTIGSAASKMKGLFGGGKSHAGGLSYVPSNGYQATLHKGERVLTPEENKAYSNGEGKGGGTFNFYFTPTGGSTEQQAEEMFKYFVQKIEQAGGAGA